MVFAHSIGQDFFKDLLHYTNEHTPTDKSSIHINYELQKRLSELNVNNDLPTLLKSKKYSGEVSLTGHKEPLGGPISHKYDKCTDEFPFWSLRATPDGKKDPNMIAVDDNKHNENNNDSNDNNDSDDSNVHKEHFTQEYFTSKENFDGSNTGTIFIVIVAIIILLLTIMFFARRMK